MDPVQPARHPGAGLIEVGHRRGGELVADGGQEAVQPGCTLGQDGGQGAGGQRRTQHVGQQLRGPVHRQMLVHAQIAHQRPHPRPIAGRRADMVGERRGGGRARRRSGAARPDARSPAGRSGGRSNTWRASTPTTGASARSAPHPPHRPGYARRPRRARRPGPGGRRGRRAAYRAGALGLPHRARLRPRGLAQPVRGRRLGRVRRVPTEPTLQLGHPRLQRRDHAGLRSVGRAQLDDDRGLDHARPLPDQDRGRDRGLQATTSGHARLPMGRTGGCRATP